MEAGELKTSLKDEEGDKEKEERAQVMGRKKEMPYFSFFISFSFVFSLSCVSVLFPFEVEALQEEAGGDPHCYLTQAAARGFWCRKKQQKRAFPFFSLFLESFTSQ